MSGYVYCLYFTSAELLAVGLTVSASLCPDGEESTVLALHHYLYITFYLAPWCCHTGNVLVAWDYDNLLSLKAELLTGAVLLPSCQAGVKLAIALERSGFFSLLFAHLQLHVKYV